ncbi:MAG: glycosyltransferase family 2 protein [Phycisphaerales bacterium]|nr:glycosyltransferase family 2 protein [Phycisphaerales bacterium]MCB9857981.1 glycosyltransferase family 2 protein [Phycisphaerales bacterium]MCB9864926.1 glycosyltransferase family 2 protein [Phycisphaerales bacterium]
MISVLSVNYHAAEDLKSLAESLREFRGGEPVELVVCNNSRAETLTLESTDDLPVTILDEDNIGFGAGINRAFSASKGDTIFIANPDVRVTDGALAAGAAYLADHPDAGIVLPLLRYPDGTIQPSVRRFYTWPVVFYARSPVRGLAITPQFFRDYLCESIDRSAPSDVDWGLGAAMFLRRRDIAATGPFDDRFFLYFEDVDLCHRTWKAGRRVVYCPQIECVHAHRRASRKALSAAGWHHFQSLLRFVRKHRGLPKRP